MVFSLTSLDSSMKFKVADNSGMTLADEKSLLTFIIELSSSRVSPTAPSRRTPRAYHRDRGEKI